MILRPANRALYIASTLLITAAALYAAVMHPEPYRLLASAVAVLIALPWGAYYALLRVELTESGICRRSLFGTRRIDWGEGTCFRLLESRTEETASQTLIISRGETTITLSSDLLAPEQVEELVSALRERGLLTDEKQVSAEETTRPDK